MLVDYVGELSDLYYNDRKWIKNKEIYGKIRIIILYLSIFWVMKYRSRKRNAVFVV